MCFGARASTNLGMLHTDIIICLLHRSADKSPHNSGHKITSLGKHTAFRNIAKKVVLKKKYYYWWRGFLFLFFCQFKYFSPNNCDSTRSVFTTIVMKHERTDVPYKSEVLPRDTVCEESEKIVFIVISRLCFLGVQSLSCYWLHRCLPGKFLTRNTKGKIHEQQWNLIKPMFNWNRNIFENRFQCLKIKLSKTPPGGVKRNTALGPVMNCYTNTNVLRCCCLKMLTVYTSCSPLWLTNNLVFLSSLLCQQVAHSHHEGSSEFPLLFGS